MTKLIRNGWEILFHPKFFGVQYQELFDRVTQLKQRFPEAEYKTHATVKLFAAITISIETKIPADPFASHFALTGPLKRYGRMKKMGLSDRYRLFSASLIPLNEKRSSFSGSAFPAKKAQKMIATMIATMCSPKWLREENSPQRSPKSFPKSSKCGRHWSI